MFFQNPDYVKQLRHVKSPGDAIQGRPVAPRQDFRSKLSIRFLRTVSRENESCRGEAVSFFVF